jgi:hypothetical protein
MSYQILIYVLPVLLGLFTANPADHKATQSQNVDLDGDGVLETISMEYTESWDDFGFTLHINDLSVGQELGPMLNGFELVDIDTRDNYREIVITTPGESDDYESLVYAFYDSRIIEVAHIYGLVEFDGSGDMYADSWMGFWTRTDKFRLNPDTHRLDQVPQDLYPVRDFWNDSENVGLECVVIEAFPIFSFRYSADMLEYVDVGSDIEIIGWSRDPSHGTDWSYDWFLILTETGLFGWVQHQDFVYKVDGIHWAD